VKFSEVANIDDLTPEAFDALPFGAICIRADGTITQYNQFESHLAQLDAERVIGKNFFRQVAPCTAVQAFEGRLREFAASGEPVSETFDFTFAFARGEVEVCITFARLRGSETFLIAVERID
jgi:photoactive yellow protein